MAASIPLITADGMKCVKPPNLNAPNKICSKPAIERARKKAVMLPEVAIAAAQMAVRPAAGPLTLSSDREMMGMTIPPMIPARSPEKTGALLASEIPKQSGSATKKL